MKEYGSTLYVGMARIKHGPPCISRVRLVAVIKCVGQLIIQKGCSVLKQHGWYP